MNSSHVFSEENKEDDEWGFYPDEHEPGVTRSSEIPYGAAGGFLLSSTRRSYGAKK